MHEHGTTDDRAVVDRIVHATYPDAAVDRITDRSGMAHRTVVAHLSGAPHDRVVARWLIHDHLADRFERESAVLDHVAETTDIPVPAVLGHDPDAEPPHTLMTFRPGDHRQTRFFRPHRLPGPVVRHAGELLGRLHAACPRDAAGQVLPRDGLPVQQQDWDDLLHGTVTAQLDQLADLPDFRFADMLPALRGLVDDHVPGIAMDGPVLLHHDYRPANLLTRDGTVTAVVDWERAMSGDPLYDLVKAEMNIVSLLPDGEREERWDAFMQGYRDEHQIAWDADRAAVYRLLHLIEILWAFPVWAPTADPEMQDRRARELRGRFDRCTAAL